MKKTFYQLASDKLTGMGYTPTVRGGMVGVFGRARQLVVLKNRTSAGLFRGFPEKASALLLNDDGVFPLYPDDFKLATKVEVNTNE